MALFNEPRLVCRRLTSKSTNKFSWQALVTLDDHLQFDGLPISGQRRIPLFDSSTPAATFTATLRAKVPGLHLVIFETSCFSNGSGRIRRVLTWARRLLMA